MGTHEDRLAFLLFHFQKLNQVRNSQRIEPKKRLIHDKEARIHDKSTDNHDLLLHPFGEMNWKPVQFLVQTKHFQQRFYSLKSHILLNTIGHGNRLDMLSESQFLIQARRFWDIANLFAVVGRILSQGQTINLNFPTIRRQKTDNLIDSR